LRMGGWKTEGGIENGKLKVENWKLENWGIAIESRIDRFVNCQFSNFNCQFAIPSILDPRFSFGN
jgi:hypothetical protein